MYSDVDAHYEIASWLKTLRERARLSLPEAARRSELPEMLLNFWEQGYPLTVYGFIKLMAIYQVPPELTAAKILSIQRKIERP